MGQISRREFLAGACRGASGALAAYALGGAAAFAAEERKPNIIVILVDDMGWTDTSCYGSTFYETPNIDRLAREGMKFTNGYAACPVCSPTRASIMTGQYPARLHLTNWIPGYKLPYAKLREPKFNQQLPLEEVTIAEILKESGYVTASMGKWHLGKTEFYPEKQGFDVNFGGTHQGHPPTYFYPYKIPNIKTGKDGEYLTDRLTDEVVAFIDKNKDKPFFLYMPQYGVHTPIEAKKDMTAKYEAKMQTDHSQKNAAYAAMIESVDQSVGRVMAKLEELGIADDTVIVFTSDNGGLEKSTSNAPLRAGKGTLYEGGVREPWLVRWPKKIKAGTTCDVPVASIDLYPTLLAAAGAKPDPGRPVDGVNTLPLLTQKGGIKRDAIYWHYPHYHPGGATPGGIVRSGDYKLIEFYEDDRVELYDLKKDIGEKHDLAAEMPQKAAELRKMLADWRKSVDAAMPTPNPDYDPAKATQRQVAPATGAK